MVSNKYKVLGLAALTTLAGMAFVSCDKEEPGKNPIDQGIVQRDTTLTVVLRKNQPESYTVILTDENISALHADKSINKIKIKVDCNEAINRILLREFIDIVKEMKSKYGIEIIPGSIYAGPTAFNDPEIIAMFAEIGIILLDSPVHAQVKSSVPAKTSAEFFAQKRNERKALLASRQAEEYAKYRTA